MSSLVHPASAHLGGAQLESATPRTVRPARTGLNSTKALAAMLLAAVVAALLVVANQLVDNWSDGNLLAAWVILWAVGFAALGLCAGTARKLAVRAVAALDAWSQHVAEEHADTRYLAAAMEDPRIMADLRRALDDGDLTLTAPARAEIARVTGWYTRYLRGKHVDEYSTQPRAGGIWLQQF